MLSFNKIMFLRAFIFLWFIVFTHGRHFDGGTITWAPVDPYDTTSPLSITITQLYAWAYPTITCANNVPTTTFGRSTENWNLICVTDCSTDGGYSTQKINILTDCISVSTSLGMMTSKRSHNLSLTAGAHFYLANRGSAWVALNDPPQSGYEWSIVTFIDLRPRPDGFINTPPVASFVSPQYAIVNRTMHIHIPVSDVNPGDDVRCRWSTFTSGYRRRKRSDEEEHVGNGSTLHLYKNATDNREVINKRQICICIGGCGMGTFCCCSPCDPSTCPGLSCMISTGCASTASTSPTTLATTTIDTPGILKSTSTYPVRQAIDECGDICYPSSVPAGTTLSDCTITLTAHKVGIWYAVALQVEDFINENSTTPLSSVPVQLLVYVMPDPVCAKAPIILPLNRCLEVQVGAPINFDIYALNLCDPMAASLVDMIVSTSINNIIYSNLTSSPTNSSLSYIHFTWTPQANQIGSQQLCTIAYTDEQVQSQQYCVKFTVKSTSDLCITTTTTTTSTTSFTSTTSLTSTSTTATTSTSTTSSTSTSSTSTSSTSTSTTTSVSTSTSSTTTTTTVTTTTVTTTKPSKPSINWLLILGISLLALLLSLCCCCCCYYLYKYYLGIGARRRRRQKREHEEDTDGHILPTRNIFNKIQKPSTIRRLSETYTNSNSYDMSQQNNSEISNHSSNAILFPTKNVPIYIPSDRSSSFMSVDKRKPWNDHDRYRSLSSIRRSRAVPVRVNKLSKWDLKRVERNIKSKMVHGKRSRSNNGRVTVTRVSRCQTFTSQPSLLSNTSNKNLFELQPITTNRSELSLPVVNTNSPWTVNLVV